MANHQIETHLTRARYLEFCASMGQTLSYEQAVLCSFARIRERILEVGEERATQQLARTLGSKIAKDCVAHIVGMRIVRKCRICVYHRIRGLLQIPQLSFPYDHKGKTHYLSL